jgi:hypothetical protein
VIPWRAHRSRPGREAGSFRWGGFSPLPAPKGKITAFEIFVGISKKPLDPSHCLGPLAHDLGFSRGSRTRLA